MTNKTDGIKEIEAYTQKLFFRVKEIVERQDEEIGTLSYHAEYDCIQELAKEIANLIQSREKKAYIKGFKNGLLSANGSNMSESELKDLIEYKV